MHYKKIVSQSLCSIICVLIAAIPLFSQPPENAHCGKGQDSCGYHMFKDLNLTDQQRTKLKALREENRPLHKDCMQETKELRQKIKEELLKDAPDREVLGNYSHQIAASHEKMASGMTEHLLKVKEILTKEQFEKLLSSDFRRDKPRDGKNKTKPHGCCPHEQNCPPPEF